MLNPEALAQFETAIKEMDPAQLQAASREAITQMPPETKQNLSSMAQKYLQDQGGAADQVSAAGSGDPDVLSGLLSGVMKEGPSGLTKLLGQGGAGGGDLGSMAGQALGGSGGGLMALLSNPQVKGILMALVPVILKKFQGR
jgi:hypothetical protein